MPQPTDALRALARELRDEGSVISPHVVDPGGAEPALGLLVAGGPRARSAPAEYALVVEAVREGYELHYGAPRIVAGADDDLALLAGDYLYALGLERLAAIGDTAAVAELADLISLCAQLHADGRAPAAGRLWLASAVAIACGRSPEHDAAAMALRAGDADAANRALDAAREMAREAGLGEALERAAEAIDLAPLRG